MAGLSTGAGHQDKLPAAAAGGRRQRETDYLLLGDLGDVLLGVDADAGVEVVDRLAVEELDEQVDGLKALLFRRLVDGRLDVAALPPARTVWSSRSKPTTLTLSAALLRSTQVPAAGVEQHSSDRMPVMSGSASMAFSIAA